VRLRSFLLDLAALALVLLAPFIVLLSFHGYSYLTAEFLLILAAALGAAALLALPVGASRLLRALALGALLALFIDLHVSWPQWSSAAIVLTFLAAVVGLAVIVWLLNENATKIVVAAGADFGGAQMIWVHPLSGARIVGSDFRREAYGIGY
jgi:hypothetical protein